MSVSRSGPVLRCTVTGGRGTLDFDAVRATTAALRAVPPDVGAVLLAGEGPHFCVGADVADLAAAGARGGRGRRPGPGRAALAGDLHDLVRALVEAPVPVVAVRGWAAGADEPGAGFLADVAVAGVSTRLRPAYPAIGLSPDGGLTWTLPWPSAPPAPATSCSPTGC